MLGDIEKYGPRGTNEFNFQATDTAYEEYFGGRLAESWEITSDPLGIIFHIRPGVMWAGNEKIGMEPREVTATDVAYHFQRARDWNIIEMGWTEWAFVDSITATDKYTVVVEWNTYNPMWSYEMVYGWGGGGAIIPVETVVAGVSDWQNQVSNGAFIMTEFVRGSQAIYEPNPSYWETTTINGKEYQLPFVDRLVFPALVDEPAQIAALQTGLLDWSVNVPYVYGETLTEKAPDLVQSKFLLGSIRELDLRTDQVPFNNRDVRRALMIGTDLEAIRDVMFGEGEVHTYPVSPGTPGYTPIEELPASSKLLFEYDPEAAKQMLAAAGYPNGFSMDVTLVPDPEEQDIISMLIDMWSKIGVEVNPIVLEQTAFISVQQAFDFDDAITQEGGPGFNSISALVQHRTYPAGQFNYSKWSNSEYDALMAQVLVATDPVKRADLMTEAALIFIDDAPVIPFANQMVINAYWPWMKNYYGELNVGFYNYAPILARIWIDQTMKKDLGY